MATTTDEHKLVVALEARVRTFERAMTRAQRKSNQTVEGIETRFAGMQRRLDRTFNRLGRSIAGALSIAALNRAAVAIRNIVSEVDGIGKAADRIGLTTTALQELRYAGELAGVRTNALEMSMQRFSRRIGEAASGTGQLQAVLEANGVELRDAEGNMRSLTDLLGDYANLIQNAGSEQEQLTLAVRAFDSEGAVMVNMLRNGAGALADVRQEASDLGAVLDEEMVRGAEEVNDRFTRLSNTVRTRFQSAVLTSVDFVDELVQSGREAADTLNALFEAARAPESRLRSALQLREAGLSVPGDESFPNYFDRSSFTMPTDPSEQRPTIIPGATDEETAARTRNANAMVAQANATRALIAELEFENSLIGMSAEQQDIAIAQRRAGSQATDEQRSRIAELIRARETEVQSIDRQREAHEDLQDSLGYLSDTAFDGLMSIARGAESAEDAVRNLAFQLAQAVAQAALMGSGPLSGLFGGSNVVSSLIGSLSGSVMHDGGIAGGASPARTLPATTWAGAPRFHEGLLPNELPAILERGEAVLTRQHQETISSLLGSAVAMPNIEANGLSSTSGSAGATMPTQPLDITLTVDDDGALKAFVEKTSRDVSVAIVQGNNKRQLRMRKME